MKRKATVCARLRFRLIKRGAAAGGSLGSDLCLRQGLVNTGALSTLLISVDKMTVTEKNKQMRLGTPQERRFLVLTEGYCGKLFIF